MSDKNLTELEWRKFSKGKGYKDAAFVKALAALELGKTPQAKLDALADIEKQAALLRKAAKGDEGLGSYLDDAEDAAGKERKLQELYARKATQAAAADDEEETPALLTTGMIPLLRQVKKGEPMQVLVASTGKEAAVLLSKRTISPSKRKLLTNYLGVGGTVKFAPGEAIWEENAVTFVLQTQAAGMAKKLKAALLKQTEQRTKVRVRGEDPNDIDDDGDPPELESGEAQGQDDGATKAGSGIPAAPPLPPTGAPTARTENTAAGVPASGEAAAFNMRLAALMPKVKEAITAAGPNAADVKRKVSEAGVAARKHAFGPANALLDAVQALLDRRAGGGDAGPSAEAVQAVQYQQRLSELEPRYLSALPGNPADAARLRAVFGYAGEQAAGRAYGKALDALRRLEGMLDIGKPAEHSGDTGLADYRRTLLGYRAAAARVKGQIDALKVAIPGQALDDADLADELAEALGTFNDDLLAIVEEAVKVSENTASPSTWALKARVVDFIAEVEADPLIKHVDRNPYGVSMSIEKTLREALESIRDTMPESV